MKVEELKRLNHHLSCHTGLNFNSGRLSDLERGIEKAAPELGFDDPQQCLQWLLEAPLEKKQIDVLSSILTVGETYFFRQQESFDILRDRILPTILQSSPRRPRKLRIWSAACSSGEEAYSVAILLDRLGGRIKGLDITILATDINIKALEKAESGIYTQWAFRNTPQWVQKDYFTPRAKNSFEILPRIKEMVMFEYLNLAKDGYPSMVSNTNAMDIIFCRNVLMYFAAGKAKEVVGRLHHSLVSGGWLFVAPTDAFHLNHTHDFNRHPDYTTIYSKSPSGSQLKQHTSITAGSPPPTPVKTTAPVNNLETGKINKQSLQRAQELFSSGNYNGVIELLEPLTRHPGGGAPNGSEVYLLLARTQANLGNLDEALVWSERALEIDKLDTQSHYLRAIILLEQGRIAEAVQTLRRCIYLDPGFILGHFTLGNLYYQEKNNSEAQRFFNNTLELLNPLPPDTPVSLEEGLYAGRLKEIIEATQKMISDHIALHDGAAND